MIVNQKFGKFRVGIWISIIALCLCLLAMIMQAYSILDWEGAIKLGVQNDSFNGGPEERTLAKVEYGVALADIVWVVPLLVIALYGVFRKKIFGLISSFMVFAICVYFPLFFSFQRWNSHRSTAVIALLIFALPSLLGIITLWFNKSEFK